MAKDQSQRIVERTLAKRGSIKQTLYAFKFMALHLWHDEVLQFVAKPLLFPWDNEGLKAFPFLH